MYNVRIPRAQEILGVERTVHTAEHLASAMFYLGAPVGEIPRAKLVASAGASAWPAQAESAPRDRRHSSRCGYGRIRPGAPAGFWRWRNT